MTTTNTNPRIQQLRDQVAHQRGEAASASARVQEARASQQASTSDEGQERADANWWTATNAMTISSVVLGFGLVALCLASWLLRAGRNADSILRISGTILIIVSAVFLVVAGYSQTQMGPVMGLLGTIAGYLLGKENSRSTLEMEKKSP
jgi:hypothetical protein